MITEIEVGKTYRLIDKEGYFKAFRDNESIYKRCFRDNLVTVNYIDNGYGYIDPHNDSVIGVDEFDFFEEVYTKVEDTLTRCQELAAEYNDTRFTVEYRQQVLTSLIQLLTTGETK